MKTQTATHDTGALEQMGRDLLGESFARENAFAEMNLDAIGRVLEESGDEIADAEGEMQESFARCKDLYCLLLLEAEGAGDPTLLQRPIGSWGGSLGAEDPMPALPDLGDERQDPEAMTSILDLDEAPPVQLEAEPAEMEKLQPVPPKPRPPAAPSLRIAEMPHDVFPAGPRAKEAFDLAQWLENQRSTFPFPAQQLDRLVAQNFCFAVELECQDRVPAVLKNLWSQRRPMITTLLRAKDDDLRWPEPIRSWLESLPHTHPEHCLDPHFPTVPALHALRYVYAIDSWEEYRPTLLDTGVLLLLFGQNLDGPGISLRNPMKVEGVDSADVTEAGLRLLRLQRLRNIALTPGANIEFVGEQGRSLRSLVEEDARALMPLLMRTLNGFRG